MSYPSRLIAVIEDEPSSSEALALVLSDWGAEVAVGAHANDIVAKLGPRVADVGWIITEHSVGDGKNCGIVVDPITDAAPGARVLVLSGELNPHRADAAAKAGFEVMDKPARPDKIVAWLERA